MILLYQGYALTLINLSLSTCLDLETDIFPYGEQEGDVNLPSADDTSSGIIDLSSVGFPFYGANETVLYVSIHSIEVFSVSLTDLRY